MTTTDGEATDGSTLINSIVSVIIFVIVSITFLFPLNRIITLDRRSVAVVGATLCYAARLFTNNGMNILNAIDFDVLVLLASIMAINHIIVHLKETRYFIQLLQLQIQKDPLKGFWLVSFLAFIIAPFLTNDGVCLLFVEIILNAFQDIPDNNSSNSSGINNNDISYNHGSSSPYAAIESPSSTDVTVAVSNVKHDSTIIPTNRPQLVKADAIYFLLALSCSSNIGSALTYTGNPQNMIVAQDALSVLSPMQFLGYMLVPTVLSWFMSKCQFIYFCPATTFI